MRARLIANPKSGADRAPELLPLINHRLRTIVRDLDITLTAGIEDAERGAARAVEDGCDALYVAGGDGTLNAVLRTMMRMDPAARVPIGIIPVGTGNDFAKALDLGEEPGAALDRLLERTVIDVDIGMVNDRPFANTSAGGFIAEVSGTVTEGLKDVTGKLAYVIGGARVLFGAEPFSARLLMNGEGASAGAGERPPNVAASFDIQMFAVCNARFIGGGYAIAPNALIDDGLLDVIIVPRMTMLEFVGVLQRIAAGADPGHPDVMHFRAAAFDFDFSRQARVNTDGELFEAQYCRYSVRREAARFFCGPEPHAIARPVRL